MRFIFPSPQTFFTLPIVAIAPRRRLLVPGTQVFSSYSATQLSMTSAAALRASQLEMWQADKSPNLWAAFTVRGEGKIN